LHNGGPAILLVIIFNREAVVKRGSRIRISKTRIRHHMHRLAKYAVEDIDRLRRLVQNERAGRQRELQKRIGSLPLEVQEFLADEVQELDNISQLADQLFIVALYGVVEINTARMLAHEFGKPAARNASKINKLHSFLKDKKGLELTSVPHYRAIDELRLLNNAIKHAGQVTRELAKKYPRWHEGKQLDGLDKAYNRLRPSVSAYIFRLAERMKLRYK
jgi:hypothetical protein